MNRRLSPTADSEVIASQASHGEATAARSDARVWDECALGYDMPIPALPRVRNGAGESVLTPTQAADVLAIRLLQQAYGQLHEYGSADEIADLFTPDAELYCIYLGSRGFRGRQQIRDWYAFWLPFYAEVGHYYRHRPLNQVIDLDGDRACSHAILVADGTPRANTNFERCWGRYTHEVLRTSLGWRFHRSWIALHVSTAWLPRVALTS